MHLCLCLMHLKQDRIHLQKSFSRPHHSLSSNASRVCKHHSFMWFAQDLTPKKCVMICIVWAVFNCLIFSCITWKKNSDQQALRARFCCPTLKWDQQMQIWKSNLKHKSSYLGQWFPTPGLWAGRVPWVEPHQAKEKIVDSKKGHANCLLWSN